VTEDEVQRFGAWRLIGFADSTGNRSIVRCGLCGYLSLISREALEAGGVFCSGCARPHSATPDARADSFASGIAGVEGRNAWKRHKGGGGGS
jgi:hypothetical protein